MQFVVEAAAAVGSTASDVPSDALPLLERMYESGAKTPSRVVKMAQELMRCSQLVGQRGISTMNTVNRLISRAEAVKTFVRNVRLVTVATESSCVTLASSLQELSDLAQETAAAAAQAAVGASEAQGRAEALAEMLGRAQRKVKKKKNAKASNEAGKGEKAPDSDSEKSEDESPMDTHGSNRRLLTRLNADVVALQKELRTLVCQRPQLLRPVAPAEKELVFAVVAELVRQIQRGLLRASLGSAAERWLELLETSTRFVRVAASWDGVAVPSFEARALRGAALVDAELLEGYLREELLEGCLALAPDGMHTATVKAFGGQLSSEIRQLCSGWGTAASTE